MKASVIIPTRNAGLLFSRVLDAVLDQNTPWDFEILVVDLGSNDGTLELCRDRNVRVHTIESHGVGHGHTCNTGISITRGEFAVMLAHDALPVRRDWLANLVHPLDDDYAVAGAFGRHLPYPDADLFVARDLELHFDGFCEWPAVTYLNDPDRYATEVGYRQVLHYFSNNNACLRRSVWEEIPYPDVEFAEDQLWARRIIEAGYGKAYVDDAPVYHSHSYSTVEVLRRSVDESRAFRRLFGYNLCPSLAHLLWQTGACTRRDIKYLLATGGWRQDPTLLIKNPARNLLRQTGYFLGRLPHLAGIISLGAVKKRKVVSTSVVYEQAASPAAK